MKITDFLTNFQITKARIIYKKHSMSSSELICEEIIRPNLIEINKKLGQENDPRYLAYLCEYFFSRERT